MAGETLQGMKVAILVTDGFEQVELTEPRKALDQAGADTKVVSPKGDEVRGWNFTDWGQSLPVDLKLDDARPQAFDALLLPGGVMPFTSRPRVRPSPASLRSAPSPAVRERGYNAFNTKLLSRTAERGTKPARAWRVRVSTSEWMRLWRNDY